MNDTKPTCPSTKSTLVFLLLVLATCGLASAHGVVRFDNGKWLDGGSFHERTMYSVDGVLAKTHTGAVDRAVDLGGAWVVPPLGNAHSHALASPRFAEEQTLFLARGTFYVANPNCPLDGARAARPLAAKAETVDVTYANGGLTSSGGHPAQIYDGPAGASSPRRMEGQAYFAVDDAAALERQWPRILAGEPDFIKVYLEYAEEHATRKSGDAWYGRRGLDPALLPPILERARAAGLRVSAHVSSAFDFRAAVAAGVDEIAHLPLARLDPETAVAAARNGTVVVTTVTSHRPTSHVEDIAAVHRDNLELLKRAGVRLVIGTDSDRSEIDEALAIRHLGVLDDGELARLLWESTPRWIFPERKIGALSAGSEASFLALEANPLENLEALRRIALRVKQGHVIELAPGEGLPSIGQALAHVAMSRGVDAAVGEYRRMRREEADRWDFSEQQLNALGYALLQHGQVDGAIAIFALNVEMFPQASNPYDSLAEAYALAGQRELAIANYRRSLELNPNNANARQKLQELEK